MATARVPTSSPSPVRRARPEAVTSVELVWQVPPPPRPLPRATPRAMPAAQPQSAMLRSTPRSMHAESSAMASRSMHAESSTMEPLPGPSSLSSTTLAPAQDRGAPARLRLPRATRVPPPPFPMPRATPMPPLPVAKLGVMTTPLPGPMPLPSMHELADLARAINGETEFRAAALRLESEAKRLTRSSDALCVAFDWARRTAVTAHGPIVNDAVRDLVAEVAGSGRWSLLGNALVVPIGPAPARAVLALRRPSAYQLAEAGMVSALCGGVAATLERLIASARP